MEVLFLRFEYITQYQCRATNVEQLFSDAVNDNGKIVKFVLRSKQKKPLVLFRMFAAMHKNFQ